MLLLLLFSSGVFAQNVTIFANVTGTGVDLAFRDGNLFTTFKSQTRSRKSRQHTSYANGLMLAQCIAFDAAANFYVTSESGAE